MSRTIGLWLVFVVCQLSAPLTGLGQDDKPWTAAEKDIDIYYSMRATDPAPILDAESIQSIRNFITIRDAAGNDLDIKITNAYGITRQDSAGIRKVHHGWDIATPAESQIWWMGDSVESRVEGKNFAPWNGQMGSMNCGYQITVATQKDNHQYVLRFCHLLNEDDYQQWNPGDKIDAGIILAKVGTSGRVPNALRPHLHLEIFRQDEDQYVRIDPQEFFQIRLKHMLQAPTGLRIVK